MQSPSHILGSAGVGRWPWLLLALVVLFNAITLAPELAGDVPSRNDSALHLLMVHAASAAMASGANPLDFWIPELELGYPQFLYYQHLPHLLLAALHRLSGERVSVETLFHGSQYLLLVCAPLTAAWSARRMGLSPAAAALAGASVSLISAFERFGFEYGSYLWSGFGLYTQLWGMHLSFVALAGLVVTLRDGRQHVTTGLSLAVLALSHLLYASIMGATSVVVLLAGATRSTLLPRTMRLAVVGGLSVCMASYMLLPFAQSSSTWLSSMPWVGPDTSAPNEVLQALIKGDLWDAFRWPVLTLLATLGVVIALVRRDPLHRIIAAGLLFWLVQYVFKPTLGPLGNLLPAHEGFVSFRLAGVLGMFTVLAIGVAGDWLYTQATRVRQLKPVGQQLLATAVLLTLLVPALLERQRSHAENGAAIASTRAALRSDTDLQAVLAFVQGNRGGRVYAGPRDGWGDALRVGPSLRVNDMLNAKRVPAYGNPYQGLALHSGLLFNIPDSSAALFDLFDIRTVITPSSATVPPFFSRAATLGAYAVYRVSTSGVANYVHVTDRRATNSQDELFKAQVAWIRGTDPAQRRVTRWDYAQPAGSLLPRTACPDGGRTVREEVSSQQVAVVVLCTSALADTLSVAFKMTYHPQWQAWVDGQPTTPYMVSPGFIAVDVPPGEHRVDLRYRAHRAKVPLLLLGLLVLALATWYRSRLDWPAAWVVARARR